MSKTWQLQDAKNRFSELIDTAIKDGPQKVTRRGRPVAVVVAAKDQRSLFEFFNPRPLRPSPSTSRGKRIRTGT